MEESILRTIKSMIGAPDDDAFDQDIITHINAMIMILRQIGIGPQKGYSIYGNDETWTDYLGDELGKFESVKSFIYLRTKLVFDPPANATVLQAMEKSANEIEWRLNFEYELTKE